MINLNFMLINTIGHAIQTLFSKGLIKIFNTEFIKFLGMIINFIISIMYYIIYSWNTNQSLDFNTKFIVYIIFTIVLVIIHWIIDILDKESKTINAIFMIGSATIFYFIWTILYF